ncbi:ATP-binding protein [Sphaerisporangium aureirubrum]|uniref:ATP-binding protein n=1 Tax=Sphaerisporangium aureirubrum TaxID=1544736 RepID=A0ABW1NNL0_9ACTN
MDAVTPRRDIWLSLEDASAIGAARRIAIALAKEGGFSEDHTGRIGVAVSEAASNLVKHATAGVMLIRPHPDAATTLEVFSLDGGPGMADVEARIRDGHSTAGTLGIGLGAISRLSDAWDVHSQPGRGTILTMRFHAPGSPQPDERECGMYRPIGDEVACGDAFAVAGRGDTLTAIVCDGLGHGIAAAAASTEAVRVFREHTDATPAVIIERVHEALGGTRGGAVAVVRLDRAARTAAYAGVGNISGWIVHAEGRQGMVSVHGIAGHRARGIREMRYELPPHGLVVLHSDGLTDRWNLSGYPGLLTHSAPVIAGTLLRDWAVRRDDACVLVMRVER